MSLQDFLYGGAHAFGGYLLQICGKQVGKAWNCIEILVPDVFLGEHALGYLAAVACGPELLETVEYLLVVCGGDGVLTALAALVVGDDGGQAEYQSLGKVSVALEEDPDARQVAGW